MSWVLDSMGVRDSEWSRDVTALDVATGTGVFARAIAPHCIHVTGLDATQAMLDQATNNTADTHDIQWVCGDAVDMPFPDASFDFVTCRLAIHHFPDPAQQVRHIINVHACMNVLSLRKGVCK